MRKNLMQLAKVIRDEVKKNHPNIDYKELTKKSMDLFHKNSPKYLDKYKK